MNAVPKAIVAVWKFHPHGFIVLCVTPSWRVPHARSFCRLTFALPSLTAFALPPAVHAATAVHGRRVRAAADCAAALRITLPDAHITAASAVPSNDSLRALRQKP